MGSLWSTPLFLKQQAWSSISLHITNIYAILSMAFVNLEPSNKQALKNPTNPVATLLS